MALAGRRTGGLAGEQADAEAGSRHAAPKLVMTAADMPRFGMHEPAVRRAPVWVRLLIIAAGSMASWALIWLVVALLRR